MSPAAGRRIATVGAGMEITLAGDVAIRPAAPAPAGPLRLPGGQARVAFAVLALERHRGVGRDDLADAVWPEACPATWRSALRSLASRVRALVAQASPAGHEALTTEAGRYQLHLPAGAVVDLEAAERGVAAAQRALAAGDHGDARQAAAEAVRVLRAPFLPGHECRWVAARRAGLAELLVAGLDVASRAATALGDGTAALVAAHEAVARAPLRESAHRALIEAHAAAGNRGEALRAYQRLRRLLADELGVDPAPETEEAYLGLLGPAHRPGPAAAPGPGPPDALAEAWRRARAGACHVVLVTGPAGAGKSRLAADAARRASADGGLVLVAGAGREGAHPHGPVVAALDPLVAASADDLVGPGTARARLSRAFPSLGGGAGGALAGGAGGGGAVAEAVDDVLAAATADRPVMVVLDDLHRAGPDDLRLLGHIAAGAHRRLLVVAVARDGLAADHPLHEATRALAAAGRLRHLPLAAGGGAADARDGVARPTPPERALAPTDPVGPEPGLASPWGRAGRLPEHTTSFVGREDEVAATQAALGAARLVTLVGAGGIGKTRLALEVARRARLADHPDGVRFCDAAAVPGADGLVEAVAAAVGWPAPRAGARRGELAASLRGARLLLVLDGCERVRPEVAALVDEALAAGPGVTVLATSRAPLRAAGERVVPVPPLPVPAPGAPDARDAPALRLLVDRARAAGATVAGDDPALAEVVRRLDGIPLAVELAAPRLAALPAGVLAAALDRPFAVLAGTTTGPARQRTLDATIDWSYRLLDADARRLFAALSVFRGGWALDGAAAVAPAVGVPPDRVPALVTSLAEQSLVRLGRAAGAARYDMLAPMAAYAADRLAASGAGDAVADRHARYAVAVAERAVPHRRGRAEGVWVAAVDVELDNLRAAFRWSVDRGRPADALRLVVALTDDVVLRDRLEVGRWAVEAAGMPGAAGDPRRAAALGVASNAALAEDRLGDALRLALDALDAERRSGAPPGWVARNVLALLTAAGLTRGTAAGTLCAQLDELAEVAESSGDPLVGATLAYERVMAFAFAGTPEEGLGTAEALLARAVERGNPTILAMGLLAHGTAVARRHPGLAADRYRAALAAASSVGGTLLAQRARRALGEVGPRAAAAGAATLADLQAQARRFEASGNVSEQVQTVLSMLGPLAAAGDDGAVATLCGGLARTPWRRSAPYRRAVGAVAGRLAPDAYRAARRAGAAMSAPQLVTFAHARAERIVAAAAPT